MLILEPIVDKTGQSDPLWNMGCASSQCPLRHMAAWVTKQVLKESGVLFERKQCGWLLSAEPTVSITEADAGQWDMNATMKTR